MSDEERPRGLSRKEKGKAKVGEEEEEEEEEEKEEEEDDDDDDQTYYINELGPGFADRTYSELGSHMCFCFSKTLTSSEVNPKGPVLYLNDYETSILLDSPDINLVSLPKKLNVFDIQHNLHRMLLSACASFRWTEYSITTGWDTYVSRHNLVPGDRVSFHRSRDIDPYYNAYNYVLVKKSDKLEIITQFKATDHVKNEPRGPGSRDGSYSALGPLMCFCLSKTLTSFEVNPEGPVLYLDAYEASILLDSPDIITSPNSVSFPKKLNVFDIQRNLYKMLLSPCARSGWTGYSITTGWDIYVSRRNLAPGDEVSFHRSRDIDSYYNAYNYVLVKKSDKLEIITQFMREPRGPGSRNMNEVAKCLSKTLTSADLNEQKPRLNFTASEAFLLTSRAEILNDDPGMFSEELVVYDECDNRYRMNISNHDTGSLTRFHVNREWEIYAKDFDLREGDDLEIYRFLDHRLVPGRFYYALKLIRKLLPDYSDFEEGSVLSRTLSAQDSSVLYIDASEAYTLTNYEPFSEPSPSSSSMILSVFDDDNKRYNMLLSYCAVNVYAISRGWERFTKYQNLKPGDRVFFHRYYMGEEDVEPFYEIKYIREEELEMTQLPELPQEKTESPECKRKPGPASSGIRDPALKLTKLLSAHQGNNVWMCFGTNEAWILTGCSLILEEFPLGTVLMNLVVYDEGDRPYDMVLTHLKRDDGEVTGTLDGGWHRFVATHGLKAGDKVTINRIQGEPYYVLSYKRAALPIGSGESGEVPGGIGASGVGPGGSGVVQGGVDASGVDPSGVGASGVGPGGSGTSGVGPGGIGVELDGNSPFERVVVDKPDLL